MQGELISLSQVEESETAKALPSSKYDIK